MDVSGGHLGHRIHGEDATVASRQQRIARLAMALALGLSAIAGPAAAREPVDPTTLNPAPPDFFNADCQRQGVQIVCTLAFSDPPIVDEPSGIVCDGVELLYSQTRDVVGKRFYTADGDLRQRHFREDMRGTLEHPTTGEWLRYSQSNTIIHDLGTPGVVASGTSRIVGMAFRVSEPRGRTVLVDAGWVAIDESLGEIVDWAGPHRLDDYYIRGDAHALDAVCEAIQPD